MHCTIVAGSDGGGERVEGGGGRGKWGEWGSGREVKRVEGVGAWGRGYVVVWN